jgi:hypothetical protein
MSSRSTGRSSSRRCKVVGQAALKPFPTEFFDTTIDVENGKIYGSLVVNTAGAVRLNPRLVGASRPDATSVSLNSSPVSVRPGQTVKLTVGGDGYERHDPVRRPQPRVPPHLRLRMVGRRGERHSRSPGRAVGVIVIVVRDGNEIAMLTGALRVFGARSRGRSGARVKCVGSDPNTT